MAPKKNKSSTSSVLKHRGSATYNARFQSKWSDEWPCIRKAVGKDTAFFCTLCKKEVSCSHQGKLDVIRHVTGTTHEKFASEIKKQSKLTFPAVDPKISERTLIAELDFVHAIVKHNVPLSFADAINRVVKKNFKCELGQNYGCGQTKTACIVKKALRPYFLKSLTGRMKNANDSFSIATDGSNDTGLEKMNPVTVRIFDEEETKVCTEFLDMCLTSGPDAAKADEIFKSIDNCFARNEIPWANCRGISLDNLRIHF